MQTPCKTKAALLRGIRPHITTPQQAAATRKILSTTCQSDCIYCDIWKLATLVASHVPLYLRYNLMPESPVGSPSSSFSSSPMSFSSPFTPIISASKKIEAQFQTQRSQLSSILSICIVAGADETEGLRMAHDRCSAAVETLLDQEEDLEEELLKEIEEAQYAYEYEHDYATQEFGISYHHERRPSLIDVPN